jgi:toxin ParE1/3/4
MCNQWLPRVLKFQKRTIHALADLERLFDFLADHDPKLTRERLVSVRRAFDLLADHPLLGREAEDGRRELILSRGKFGYLAKYRWVPAEDTVLILTIRQCGTSHRRPLDARWDTGYRYGSVLRCLRFDAETPELSVQ